MAVTWAVKIEVIDLSTRAVRVVGTRTDDALPAETGVTRYSVEGTYDTENHTPAELKQSFADALWDKHLFDAARASQVDAIKTQAEAALVTELESRED